MNRFYNKGCILLARAVLERSADDNYVMKEDSYWTEFWLSLAKMSYREYLTMFSKEDNHVEYTDFIDDFIADYKSNKFKIDELRSKYKLNLHQFYKLLDKFNLRKKKS